MVELFDSVEGVSVTIEHKKLAVPLTGFAMEGKSVSGNVGLLIFIPTQVSQVLIDLIKR